MGCNIATLWLTPMEAAAKFGSQLLIATVLPAWYQHWAYGSVKDSFCSAKRIRGTEIKIKEKVNTDEDVKRGMTG